MRTTDTRTLNWRRPIPREDPATARLLAICTALASEVTILRERLDAHERLAGEKGVFSQETVDNFEPDPQASAYRDQVRRGQISRIFRALKDEGDREARAATERAKQTAAKSQSR